jgi:DNA-binding CsgD family transcriptional regulator
MVSTVPHAAAPGPLRPAPARSCGSPGARPRRDWSLGVEPLTPSELRIVRLARDGRTNRQIAQELYVSIKTVGGHLPCAYGKLGIAAREEIARVVDPERPRVTTL